MGKNCVAKHMYHTHPRLAGAMKYLAERYDLTKIPMAGASGGALAAVLAACGVRADDAIELAYNMRCVQYEVV